MKSINSYIFEKLKISKNTKSHPSFENIQMFMQDEQFYNNGISLDYYIGHTSSDHQLVCYVEYFNDIYGESFMLAIFNDDIYLDLVKEYNLKENEDLGWNEAPEELVKIIQNKLDTELPVYVCGVGAWYDSRYNYDDINRFEQYIEKVYNELK